MKVITEFLLKESAVSLKRIAMKQDFIKKVLKTTYKNKFDSHSLKMKAKLKLKLAKLKVEYIATKYPKTTVGTMATAPFVSDVAVWGTALSAKKQAKKAQKGRKK
jgi:hypothetical protein